MKVLLIFGHPNRQSFNGAILDHITDQLNRMGAEYRVKELYNMNFNPLLTVSDLEQLYNGKIPVDIQNEQADIKWADWVILISPVWWYSVTSMLRGYIDRVFSSGFAYIYTEKGPQGLLSGKQGLLITTSGADEKTALAGKLVETLRKTFLDHFFLFCGFSQADHLNLFNVPNVSDAERKQMLQEAAKWIHEQIKA